jgi:arginase family enzyme
VPWRDGQPRADLENALDRLAARAREVYLHIDIDALDPAVAPGVVDRPVPGGLSLEQAEEAIRAVTNRFALRAVDLAVYNPDLDVENRTLLAGLRIIELLGRAIPESTSIPASQ